MHLVHKYGPKFKSYTNIRDSWGMRIQSRVNKMQWWLAFRIKMFSCAVEGACCIIYFQWQYEEEGIWVGGSGEESADNLFIIEKMWTVRNPLTKNSGRNFRNLTENEAQFSENKNYWQTLTFRKLNNFDYNMYNVNVRHYCFCVFGVMHIVTLFLVKVVIYLKRKQLI